MTRRLPDERRPAWTCPGCGFVHEVGHCLGCGYRAPGIPLTEAEAWRLGTERGPVGWPPKPPRYGKRAPTASRTPLEARSTARMMPRARGREMEPAKAPIVGNGGSEGGGR